MSDPCKETSGAGGPRLVRVVTRDQIWRTWICPCGQWSWAIHEDTQGGVSEFKETEWELPGQPRPVGLHRWVNYS